MVAISFRSTNGNDQLLLKSNVSLLCKTEDPFHISCGRPGRQMCAMTQLRNFRYMLSTNIHDLSISMLWEK